MKFVLVTGGVISGIGKGIVASSIGTILKSYGWCVTCIKIDPYLNIDAGTFSPFEHGEVFVLEDGSEVDLDLGNYERFLDLTLSKDNNITTGKIYKKVMENERRGDYLGKTVQVVPHITDCIVQWVMDVSKRPLIASNEEPEVCLIELGGTIGDIESMPFAEAFHQLQFRVGAANFCCVHVSLIPKLSCVGEPKSKPTQIISLVDVDHVYEVPLSMDRQGVCQLLLDHFQLTPKPISASPASPVLINWSILMKRILNAPLTVHVAIVGKYTQLRDAYLSVFKEGKSTAALENYCLIHSPRHYPHTKALLHAGIHTNCRVEAELVGAEDLEASVRDSNPEQFHKAWFSLTRAKAVVVPGGFGARGLDGKLAAIRFCRQRGVPFLGLCLGLQCATIEFARNVLGWEDANSVEFDPECGHPVVIEMPEFNPGQMGGTMRLGRRRTALHLSPTATKYLAKMDQSDGDGESCNTSLVHRLLGNVPYYDARHRHRYELNPAYIDELESAGLLVAGRDAEVGNRMEIIELARPIRGTKQSADHRHPYFVATQFHPEFTSRPSQPSEFFVGLLLAANKQLIDYLAKPYQLSMSQLAQNDCLMKMVESGANLKALVDQVADHCAGNPTVTSVPSSEGRTGSTTSASSGFEIDLEANN